VGQTFGGAGAGETWATSLEWQIDPQWSTRFSWEPLRRDRLLQQRLTHELTRQFSLELRRRWEYGIPPTADPAVLAEIAGEAPAERETGAGSEIANDE
jgi:hypothetical protein